MSWKLKRHQSHFSSSVIWNCPLSITYRIQPVCTLLTWAKALRSIISLMERHSIEINVWLTNSIGVTLSSWHFCIITWSKTVFMYVKSISFKLCSTSFFCMIIFTLDSSWVLVDVCLFNCSDAEDVLPVVQFVGHCANFMCFLAWGVGWLLVIKHTYILTTKNNLWFSLF